MKIKVDIIKLTLSMAAYKQDGIIYGNGYIKFI